MIGIINEMRLNNKYTINEMWIQKQKIITIEGKLEEYKLWSMRIFVFKIKLKNEIKLDKINYIQSILKRNILIILNGCFVHMYRKK